MKWTTPADVKAQAQKLWDKGLLLSSLAGGGPIFPRRLLLKGPSPKELSERFSEVQGWIASLSEAAKYYRIKWRAVNNRIVGSNNIPSEIWIETLEDAIALAGKREASKRFASMLEQTKTLRPELLPWLEKRPLKALELEQDWSQLLSITGWMLTHPRPAIYLRQMDLPAVHTKLIERHRGVLSELFDILLPEEAIDTAHSGVSGFCRRYGFLDKPLRVRFRILDRSIGLLNQIETDQDITLTRESFASLNMPVDKVFITENEVNFLAFPNVPRAMVIFGAGYGFENLSRIPWLAQKPIYYWGDIDTHGFAILNQLRGLFPHVISMLMDEKTLLYHRSFWGFEDKPETGKLERLSGKEYDVYDKLRRNHWGRQIRLEQERIRYDMLVEALRGLFKTSL